MVGITYSINDILVDFFRQAMGPCQPAFARHWSQMQHVACDNDLSGVLKQIMETGFMFDQSLHNWQEMTDIRNTSICKCLMALVLHFPADLLAHG